MPKTTLEQWITFKSVVDEGSFAKAAEALNKSQSSVSYTIAKLQEQLPAPVLRLDGRKAELTDLGKTLYRHANNFIEQADQLDKTAHYFAKGWASEVTISVDALVDMTEVFCALQAFSVEHPLTRVRILETTLSGSEEALITREADIALLARVPPGFLGDLFGKCKMIPVAHPNHALFAIDRAISEAELKQHRQLVVRDSGIKRNQDGGWLGAEQRWTVSHFATSIKAIKAGLGFAFVPQSMIEKEIAVGELKRLSLVSGNLRELPIYLVLSGQSHAGPAAKCVADYLLVKKSETTKQRKHKSKMNRDS